MSALVKPRISTPMVLNEHLRSVRILLDAIFGKVDAVEEGIELPLVGVVWVGAELSGCVCIVLDWVELIFPVGVLGNYFVFDFRLLVSKVDGYCMGQVEVGVVVADNPGTMLEHDVACPDWPCLSLALSNVGVFTASK